MARRTASSEAMSLIMSFSAWYARVPVLEFDKPRTVFINLLGQSFIAKYLFDNTKKAILMRIPENKHDSSVLQSIIQDTVARE